MSESNQETHEQISPAEILANWRRLLLEVLSRVLAVIGIFVLLAGAYTAWTSGALWQIAIYAVLYGALAVVTLWRRGPYLPRASVVVGLLAVFAILNMVLSGVNAESAYFFLALVILCVLFFGPLGGYAAIGFVVLALTLLTWLFVTGRVVVRVSYTVRSADLGGWLATIFVFLMMSVGVTFSIGFFLRWLLAALGQSQHLAQELERERAGLEERVAERTTQVARRNAQLQAVARVARDTAAIQDLSRLLQATVNLIAEQFGFYHVGIFLLDESGEYAVLRAASSEGGQEMLAHRYRLPVGQGVVGAVVGQGQIRSVLDVSEDVLFVQNPDLPETRSEVALPLASRGEIIGALDVQSVGVQTFNEQDVTMLQTLADQIAVAIDNARLFRQLEQSLDAERRAYGQFTREAWRQLLLTRPDLGFVRNRDGLLPLEGAPRSEVQKVMQNGQLSVSAATLGIPIRVRDQVIGVIDARKPGGQAWTEEEVNLMATLAQQLNDALDNARLYQETQRREAQQRLIGEITAEMRRTLDVDIVLHTAAHQIGEALRLAALDIRLDLDTDDSARNESATEQI